MIIWLAGFACACAEVYYISTSEKSTNLAGAKQAELFLGAFIVCAVILNSYATGMWMRRLTMRKRYKTVTAIILWRIHIVHRASSRYFSVDSGSTILAGRLQWSQLSRILIESALMYTLSGIIVLVATFTGSNTIYPMSDFVRSLLIPVIFHTDQASLCCRSSNLLAFNSTSSWSAWAEVSPSNTSKRRRADM